MWLFGFERGLWGYASCCEEHSEAEVVGVAVASVDTSGRLDETIRTSVPQLATQHVVNRARNTSRHLLKVL